MTVRDDMVNGFGVCHGGVTFSLADSALAFASNTHGHVTVSIENTITYPKVVAVGDVLDADGRRGERDEPARVLSRHGRRGRRRRDRRAVHGHGVQNESAILSRYRMSINNAYIVDGVRTPVGTHWRRPERGAGRRPRRARRSPRSCAGTPRSIRRAITDVILGCANQAGEDNRNVARMALLLAGLPVTVPGETVNRLCASGMSAVANAARSVKLGEGDFYVAGGVESMTRAPYVMSKASKPFARDIELFDTSLGWRFVNPKMKAKYGTDSMGQTAENVADQYEVTPRRPGRVRGAVAAEGGRGARERALRARDRRRSTFRRRRAIRSASSRTSSFARTRRSRRSAKLEAGVSRRRRIGDGGQFVGPERRRGRAAASRPTRACSELGAKPLARIVATAVAGVEPRIMGMGPVPASRRALEHAELTLDQMDVIELNEAFAAQSLACLRELGIAGRRSARQPERRRDRDRPSARHVRRAAAAHGGASSSRRRAARYALCTMCIGVGQGMATIIERV